MSLDYSKVWESMNSLETVSTKICSAREILDSAIEAHQEHKYAKVEALMYAVDEYLQYYLDEFDEKFKTAWKETVLEVKEQQYNTDPKGNYVDPLVNTPFSINNEDVITFNISDSMNDDWNTSFIYEENYSYLANDFLTQDHISNFSEEQYTDEELEAMCNHAEQQENDKVVRWQLPVEMDPSGEYFITFPDDLLDAAGLKEGDNIEWITQDDGSVIMKKIND